MPTLQRPLPFFVQKSTENIRLLLEFLPVLEAFHNLPVRAFPASFLPRRRLWRLILMIAHTFRAQTVRLAAGLAVAGARVRLFYLEAHLRRHRTAFLIHFNIQYFNDVNL